MSVIFINHYTRLLVCVLGLCGVSWVHAFVPHRSDPGFVRQEYLRDPSGMMSLAEVQRSDRWQAFSGNLMLGFTDDAVWIRATPHISPPSPEKVTVRLGAPYLDDIQLYKPDHHGQYSVKRTGDKWPISEREIAVNNFAFNLFLDDLSQVQLPLYARLKSSSTMLITLELTNTLDFQQMWEFELLLFGFVSGSALLLVLLALLQSIAFKDMVSLAFAIFQLTAFFMTIGITGIASIFIAREYDHAHLFTGYAIFSNVLGGIFFYRILLRDMQVGKWSDPITSVAAIISLMAIFLFANDHERLGLEVNIYLIISLLVTLIPLFLWALHKTFNRFNWPLIIIYALTTTSVLIMVMPLTGLFDFGRFTPYYTVLHSFILGLAFGTTLLYRSVIQLKDSMRLQFEFQKSLSDNELIRKDRDEKERFLAMLVHELRTPLSVIQIVMDSLRGEALSAPSKRRVDHAKQAVHDIDQVIERTVMADQVDRGQTVFQPVYCDLSELARTAMTGYERSRKVELNVPEPIPLVRSDPTLVKTVLSNLLDNAVKYSLIDTPVTVTLTVSKMKDRPCALVAVRNSPNQAGRPDPQKVFLKYYRSTGARRSSGSGLGLYLVAGLAQSLGGEVRYRPDLDLEGVVFEFWLPL